VLVAWPQSFLFPCVVDVPVVAGGLAQTPNAVIESPRPFFTEDRDPDLGGSFAGAVGGLHEVPSRLIDHPELDWGAVLVSSNPTAHDDYDVTTSRAVVPGAGGVPHQPPER
jgi:arabinosyltransferase B